ncbi:MAG: S8 family serine peptidase, partial [Thermoplasmata archaeon]|nr:S8 family serine peptidase [Thermoplasmata archaeon]
MAMRWTSVFLLVMIVIGGVPVGAMSDAWAPGELPSLGERPDGWWTRFQRDVNGNGIDDLLDRAYINGTGTFEDVFIGLDRLPARSDVEWLEGRGVSVKYAARHLRSIAVGPVRARDLPDLVGLDGTVLIEVPPRMTFMVEYSVPSMRARDSTEYSPYTAWDLGYDGDGQNIAIMDSGVNDQIPTGHTMVDDMDDDPVTYDPKFIAGADASTGVLVGGVAVNPEEGDLAHGSHCAGDALGTGTTHQGPAPGSRLIDIRVGALTNLNMAGVLAAIDWCIENNETDWENDGAANDGVPIVSMSFGGAASNGDDQMSQAVDDMVEAGIFAVVAAGNNGPNNDGLSTPGSADRSINVASYDDHDTIGRSDDTLSGFSARGPRWTDSDDDPYDEMKPHIAAPGSGIQSALAWSGAILVAMDGTSMATPQVSGVIALMLEANPSLRPTAPMYEQKVKNILRDTAEARGTADRPQYSEKWNVGWGYGQIDAYGAVKRAEDLTRTEVAGPDEVDSGTREVAFVASIPVTRTPYSIEDDETRLLVTISDDWGKPEDVLVGSTGDVDHDVAVSGPTQGSGLWAIEATVTHTEDIDRYQECDVTVSFHSRAPGVDIPTIYIVDLDAWTNDVMAYEVEHQVTVQPVPNVIYSDNSIDDDGLGSSSGNGDGVVNPGEIIELGVQARNVGTRTAAGVSGEIGSSSPYVSITDDVESYGNIAAGGTAWSLGDYDIEVDDATPVGTNITFDIRFADIASHIWNDSFVVTVGGTQHDVAVVSVELPERAEVGESVTVRGTLRNLGLSDEKDIDVALELNGTAVDTATIDLDSEESGAVDLEWT